MDMYAKCGNIEKARELFEKRPQQTVISWTTIIAVYILNGHEDEALKLFRDMPERNTDSWTIDWGSLLFSCRFHDNADLQLQFLQTPTQYTTTELQLCLLQSWDFRWPIQCKHPWIFQQLRWHEKHFNSSNV